MFSLSLIMVSVFLFISLFLVNLLGLTINPSPTISAAVKSTPTPTPTPSEFQSQINNLIAYLSSHGYTVSQGKLYFAKISDCQYFTSGSCYGNNPSSPYGIYQLPPGPLENRIGLSPAANLPNQGNLWPNWRLRSDEAVVFVGFSPPDVRYYSFRSYLYSRYNSNTFKRNTLFASLGNSLNDLIISLSTQPNVFNQLEIVITTADKGVNDDVTTKLTSFGYPQNIINTDILPSTLPLKMGFGTTADDFMMLYRVVNLFSDPIAGQNYINTPTAAVLRLTPKSNVVKNSYPVPSLSPRGTGVTEETLYPGIHQALLDLKTAVINNYSNLKMSEQPTNALSNLIGYNCISSNTNCAGDNWDAAYFTGAKNSILPASDSDFLIAIGVNNKTTNKATYVNLSVVDQEKSKGVAAATDVDFSGSANSFLPTNPLNDKLFVYKIARNCNGQNYCLQIPTTGDLGIALDKPISLTYRAYLEASTKVGPSYQEIEQPIFLHFTP